MEISPFYEKSMICINCLHKFKSIKVRSRFVRVSAHESDFKPVYLDPLINPLYYNVAVCPECGFSFSDDFSPYFAPGTKDIINKQITEKWTARSFSNERNAIEAIETYKLSYLSALFKKEKSISIAGITLRIGWLYRDEKNTVEELRFLKIARDNYNTSYTEGDFVGTQMSETRVLYMIAELSRRIGDDKQAIKGFSNVIESQRQTTEPKLIDMAKERWQEMREEKEKRAQI